MTGYGEKTKKSFERESQVEDDESQVHDDES
jgi:hypothetical protein